MDNLILIIGDNCPILTSGDIGSLANTSQFTVASFPVFHIPADLDKFVYTYSRLDYEIAFLLSQIIADFLSLGKAAQQVEEYSILEQDAYIVTTREENRLSKTIVNARPLSTQ